MKNTHIRRKRARDTERESENQKEGQGKSERKRALHTQIVRDGEEEARKCKNSALIISFEYLN